jgi:hypothetical protein
MVQDTSIKAYKEIIEEGLLPDMEERVFKYIYLYPNSSDRILAQMSHLAINQVTGRRNGLVSQGCVEDAGIQTDPETGRSVHTWAVPKEIRFNPKPKSKSPQKRLTRYLK